MKTKNMTKSQLQTALTKSEDRTSYWCDKYLTVSAENRQLVETIADLEQKLAGATKAIPAPVELPPMKDETTENLLRQQIALYKEMNTLLKGNGVEAAEKAANAPQVAEIAEETELDGWHRPRRPWKRPAILDTKPGLPNFPDAD